MGSHISTGHPALRTLPKMSSKADINSQIAVFVAQLKRRQISGSKEVALATANLLVRFVSAHRWHTKDSMIERVRELGSQLVAAQPHEFTCGNVVRRVLKSLRTIDEAIAAESEEPVDATTSSMFGLLSAPSDDMKTSHVRTRDQKAALIEEIHGLIDEISNDDPLFKAGLDLVNNGDVILFPSPESRTLVDFFLRAAQKRRFSVVVAESYPNGMDAARAIVEKLKRAGVPATLMPDAAVYAVLPRISKVIVSARAVLADGGCISNSGTTLACLAAKEFKRPVLAVAGSYKLSPLYPFDVESLIEVGNSGKVVDFSDAELMDRLEVLNPLYDYISPDLIDVVVTTDGVWAPNFVYRIVLDNYSAQDQNL